MAAHAHRSKTPTKTSPAPTPPATRDSDDTLNAEIETQPVAATPATPVLDAAAHEVETQADSDPRFVGFNGFNAHVLPGGTEQSQLYGHGRDDERTFQTPNNLEFFDIYGGLSPSALRDSKNRAWDRAGQPERNYEGPTWIDAGQQAGEDRLTPEIRKQREAADEASQRGMGAKRRCPDDLVDEARSYRERRHPPSEEERFLGLIERANAFFAQVNAERLKEFRSAYMGEGGADRYSMHIEDTAELNALIQQGYQLGGVLDTVQQGHDINEVWNGGCPYRGTFQDVGTATRHERQQATDARDRLEREFAAENPDMRADHLLRHLDSVHGPRAMDQGDASYIFEYIEALQNHLPNLNTHVDHFNQCFANHRELIDHYQVVEDSNGLKLYIPMLGFTPTSGPEVWREMYIAGTPPREKFFMAKVQGAGANSDLTELDHRQHTRQVIKRAMEFDEYKTTIDAWVDRRNELTNFLEPFLLAVEQVMNEHGAP